MVVEVRYILSRVAIVAFLCIFLGTSALAHIGAIPDNEEQQSSHIDDWDLTLISAIPVVGKESAFTLDVVDPQGDRRGGLEVQGLILDKDSGREVFVSGVEERRPGQYTFIWNPSFAGDYIVQFIVRGKNDELLKPTFPIQVVDQRARYALGAGTFIGALAIALGIHYSLPSKQHKRKFKPLTLAYGILGGLVIFGLSYSVATFYMGGGERGFVVCGDQGCDLAVHWHSQLEMSVCGTTFNLPLEKGDLDKQHTHKERDRLHFHALLKSDEDGKVLEPQKLRLGNLFDALGTKFTKECFGGYCNGDSCAGGNKGNLKVLINDIENTDGPDYNWKDGDVIHITFN